VERSETSTTQFGQGHGFDDQGWKGGSTVERRKSCPRDVLTPQTTKSGSMRKPVRLFLGIVPYLVPASEEEQTGYE
jgi:hypothetical protein